MADTDFTKLEKWLRAQREALLTSMAEHMDHNRHELAAISLERLVKVEIALQALDNHAAETGDFIVMTPEEADEVRA